MNRIFSDRKDGGWPEFPPCAFARLDSFEPADLNNAKEAVFSFDAIDQRWLTNGFNQIFPSGNAGAVQPIMADFWKIRFNKGSLAGPDPFDEIAVYNIEVTVRRDQGFWDHIVEFIGQDWFEIRLAASGSFEVDVYGSILADPVTAFLQSIAPAPTNVSL
ncbi:hypothetical protein ACU8L5_25525 (plasmid) [Rhizobium leguminosarum]